MTKTMVSMGAGPFPPATVLSQAQRPHGRQELAVRHDVIISIAVAFHG